MIGGLLVGPTGIVGVARADESEPVRIEPLGVAHLEPGQQRIPHVRSRDAIANDLEVRPLVVRREHRMGFRGALHLRHFHDGLVAHARLGIVRIQRLIIERGRFEVLAVAQIGVVRDGQGFDAFPPQAVQPRPQILGIARIGRAERQLRYAGTLENDVAMQHSGARRGVLVTDEGGEPARLVVTLGGRHDPLPGVAADAVVVQVRVDLPRTQRRAEGQERRHHDAVRDFGQCRTGQRVVRIPRAVTLPRYSAWSVTARKSSGAPRILMIWPDGCRSGAPLAKA